MLNFPVPYANELIYSSVARAGIRLAINSPKQLLDEIFQDREVVATIDLPAHLSKILKLLPETQFDAEKLIYQHTLFHERIYYKHGILLRVISNSDFERKYNHD